MCINTHPCIESKKLTMHDLVCYFLAPTGHMAMGAYGIPMPGVCRLSVRLCVCQHLRFCSSPPHFEWNLHQTW